MRRTRLKLLLFLRAWLALADSSFVNFVLQFLNFVSTVAATVAGNDVAPFSLAP